MVYCSHCGHHRPPLIDPDTGYICCSMCGRIMDEEIYSSEPTYINDNSSQSSFSRNSGQSQELHYDSDEAESCLTEVDCDASISRVQLDRSYSSDIEGELLDESVNDTRLSRLVNSPGFSADYMDDSTSIKQIHFEKSAAVISGVNHTTLSGDNWLSFGKDGDLTPESKLATSDKVQQIQKIQAKKQ